MDEKSSYHATRQMIYHTIKGITGKNHFRFLLSNYLSCPFGEMLHFLEKIIGY